MKKVANEGELVPCVARNGETEVELSLAEPTLGSLLVFCQGRQRCAAGELSAPQPQGPLLGNLDRNFRLIKTLTRSLLRYCTKPASIASVIAESSLATDAHLWGSATATMMGECRCLGF